MAERDKLLLRPEEAAARLSLSRSEMYRLMARGTIPYVVLEDTNQRRIVVADLNKWVARQVKAQVPPE